MIGGKYNEMSFMINAMGFLSVGILVGLASRNIALAKIVIWVFAIVICILMVVISLKG